MLITLENNLVRATLNTYAGTIESLINKTTGEEHYWQYDKQRWPRRTSVCFPICGGLIDGKYRHDGKTYEMPMHGFLREKEMKVEEQTADRLVLSFESNEETLACYPFPFRFRLIQSLEGKSLKIEYEVTNTGDDPMWFSTGAHYTYALPGAQAECEYYFSKPQKAGSHTQENGIIGPKSEDIFGGKASLSMDHLFDVASKILEMKEIDTDYIAIGKNGKLFTSVESSGFEYTILWAPKGNDNPFACIEPWAGMADFQWNDGELTNKGGIHQLAAGKTETFLQKVTLHD